jgi:hypothetical protein
VRASKLKEHRGRKFYACSCIDDSFFRIWCDEVQFSMYAQQQDPLEIYEDSIEDIKNTIKTCIKNIKKTSKDGIEDIQRTIKIGFIIMCALNIVLYLYIFGSCKMGC